MALKGINHVVLKVRDLERSHRFYRLLGFTPAGAREGMRFYRGGVHHHDLALFEVGAQAPPAPREAVGLFHFCVTVEEEGELGVLARRLGEAGYRVLGTVDHIVSRSFYALDPDGHVVEVTWDVPEAEWAHLDNPFLLDRPYELPPAPPEEP
jgi:catechol-2,3-dioxygenase